MGGVLSAMDGVQPTDLKIPHLIKRVQESEIEEVIFALSATANGQTTAHYLTDCLEPLNVKLTAIAHGVPVGGELDYLDDGTLSAAMNSRRPFT